MSKHKQIQINIPFAMTAYDYHEFGFIADELNKVKNGRTELKYEEYGCVPGGIYVAVFYTGKKPSERTMLKVIETNLSFTERDFNG